jgi:hypothetical protein
MSDSNPPEENNGVFKNARPARPQPLGRAERTEEYVSTAQWRERRWRHFSTLPFERNGQIFGNFKRPKQALIRKQGKRIKKGRGLVDLSLYY